MGEFADMAIEQGMDDWMSGYGDDRMDYDGPAPRRRPVNPLYYHNFYDNIRLEAKTPRAYLIEFSDGTQCWVAKKLCKKLTDTSVYIWYKTTLKPVSVTDSIKITRTPIIDIGEINV